MSRDAGSGAGGAADVNTGAGCKLGACAGRGEPGRDTGRPTGRVGLLLLLVLVLLRALASAGCRSWGGGGAALAAEAGDKLYGRAVAIATPLCLSCSCSTILSRSTMDGSSSGAGCSPGGRVRRQTRALRVHSARVGRDSSFWAPHRSGLHMHLCFRCAPLTLLADADRAVRLRIVN